VGTWLNTHTHTHTHIHTQAYEHTRTHTHTHLRSRGIQPVVTQPLDGRHPPFSSKRYTHYTHSLSHTHTHSLTHSLSHTHTTHIPLDGRTHCSLLSDSLPTPSLLISFPYFLSPPPPSLSVPPFSLSICTRISAYYSVESLQYIQHVISHISLHLPPPFTHLNTKHRIHFLLFSHISIQSITYTRISACYSVESPQYIHNTTSPHA
jgi:hypothetical protein